MTITAAAVSNGSAATRKDTPAQREHGMNRLREEECYYLTGLILQALSESEFLVRKLNGKVSNRTLDHDGSKGTAPLDCAKAVAILAEARNCAVVAVTYLDQAAEALSTTTSPDDLF